MDESRATQLQTHVLGSTGTFVKMNDATLLSRRVEGGRRLKRDPVPGEEGRWAEPGQTGRRKAGLFFLNI